MQDFFVKTNIAELVELSNFCWREIICVLSHSPKELKFGIKLCVFGVVCSEMRRLCGGEAFGHGVRFLHCERVLASLFPRYTVQSAPQNARAITTQKRPRAAADGEK